MPGTTKGKMGLKMSPEELRTQVTQYATLQLSKSARGQAAIVFWIILGLTVLATVVGFVPVTATLISLVLYIPLTLFMLKGHRSAIIALMALYTIDKVLQLSMMAEFSVVPILFLVMVLALLYRALQVEVARQKGV